ncbi:MAG: DUF4976 domain-containing protein [Chloroflexota bacterium]
MIRFPEVVGNRDEDHMVSNVDLASTIAEYAGITPQLPQDGHSFLALLNGTPINWTDEVLLERQKPNFFAIRTLDWKYVEHTGGVAKGEKELYDLANDPYELENLAGKAAYQSIQNQLAQRLATILTIPPSLPSDPTPTNTPSSPVATPTPTNTSTPTATPSPTSTPTPTPAPSTGATILVSFKAGGVIGGITFADEDILAYDTATSAWSIFFDGSESGLKNAADINAFYRMADGSLLLSTDAVITAPDLGRVDDSDILRYVSAEGANPARWEWYFDGSDADLKTNAEDIDAISVLDDGRVVISVTADAARVPMNGVNTKIGDEDLIAFTGQVGANTAGTWDWYFDASDVGLSTNAEDIIGVSVDSDGVIYLSTLGKFKLTGGLVGARNDIFTCTPNNNSTGLDSNCTGGVTLFQQGKGMSIQKQAIDGLQVILH